MNANDREELIKLNTEVSYIKEDVNEIKVGQESIKSKQDETGKKFDTLMFHLVGDPATKTKGLIETSRGTEIRLSRLERVYLFAGLILGVIMMFRDKIVSLFI